MGISPLPLRSCQRPIRNAEYPTSNLPHGCNVISAASCSAALTLHKSVREACVPQWRHVGWHRHLSECTEDRFCHLDRARSGAAVHDQRGLHIQPRPLLYSGFATRKCRRSDLDDAVRPGCCAWTDRRCRTAGPGLGDRWSCRLVATATENGLTDRQASGAIELLTSGQRAAFSAIR